MRKVQIYDCSGDNLTRNLKDAGCDEVMIDQIINDLNNGKLSDCMCVLNKHRYDLLDDLHRLQINIDCLDYLIYMLQKTEERESYDS